MLSSKIHRSVLPAASASSKWVNAHSNKHFAVMDPSTDKEIARVANMGRVETDEAIAAALAA
ncbi:Succinate semialdehyde dehydrogenase, mitochondrial precursor, partial [Phytophthora palmivora]